MIRTTSILTCFALTVFACGGTDNTADDAPPEASKSTNVTGGTPDEPAVLFDMSKELITQASTVVPPESGIENEGVVWLEVRTVNALIDTAWVIVSSGFAEVDVFALNNILTRDHTWKFGWGDPPFKLQVFVRLPAEGDEQEELSPKLDTEELGTMVVYAPISLESDFEQEGDVLVELYVAKDLIDTIRVVESSGNPGVDEFAMKHLMTWNHLRKPFFMGLEDESLNARIIVRHQP